MYAIVDIETTGARANQDRITEIAIVLHDGEKIIKKYETLVNPECSIPPFITQLTGITNEMVADAPKFFEVAKEIVEITDGAIFVAHNVSFDYLFVREEFARLGYVYRRKQLCTVRLSKVAFPGKGRYNLDAMIQFLGLSIEQRHRAMGDAFATVKLFEAILAQNNPQAIDQLVNRGVQASKLPPNFTLEQLHDLPEQCGVYYFHNQRGAVIYVGKSINIKKRIMEHFANTTPKAQKMIQSVHDISFQLTGSELVALLMESHEIKTLSPEYNVAQKPRQEGQYGILQYTDAGGYLCLSIAKRKKNMEILSDFTNRHDAIAALKYLQKAYQLCDRKLELNAPTHAGACFHYQIGQCGGACQGLESPDAYNERVVEAVSRLSLPDWDDSFVLLDVGRNRAEQSVIWVENGQYQGFGYVDTNEQYNLEDLQAAVTPYPHNPDVVRILRGYLKNNRLLKLKYEAS